MHKLLVLVLLMGLVTSCSGLVGKGDKLYEQGLYEEAAGFYQRALNKSPDNVDAHLGLSRARYKILDRGLIDVRMLRLAANMPGATQKLEQLLRHRQAWNTELQGAISSTLSEETGYARSWLRAEGKRLANEEFPDRYRWHKYAYRQLIVTTEIGPLLTEYDHIAKKKGKQRCLMLAKTVSGQRFFLAAYTQKYCSAWGQDVHLNVDKTDVTRFSSLHPAVAVRHFTGDGERQDANLEAQLNQLQGAFRQSIWYAPKGSRTLSVDVSGQVRYRRSAKNERRRKIYTVNKTVIRKDEAGKEIRAVIEEEQIYAYIARVFRETFKVDIVYRAQLLNQPVSRRANVVKNNTTTFHTENFPGAGLTPLNPEFLNLSPIFNQQMKRLNADFLAAMQEVWKTEYCETQISQSDGGESVLRCGKLNPQHVQVNAWVSQVSGIDYQQMASLYDL